MNCMYRHDSLGFVGFYGIMPSLQQQGKEGNSRMPLCINPRINIAQNHVSFLCIVHEGGDRRRW